MPRPRLDSTLRSLHMGKPSSNAPTLPRLPVPDLSKTLDKYIVSLEPFLLEDETRGGMPYHSAHALRAKWAHEFNSGIGKILQHRLLALDRASPNNWLTDNFWVEKAYLEWRAPLLVNSNWWVAFKDDELIPRSALAGETNDNRAGTTFWQIRRAAWLVHRMLEWKDKLDLQGVVHPDTTRTGIWLRENTSQMFNVARIPKPLCDVLSFPEPVTTQRSRSLLVMIHNWCYSVTVYHPPTCPFSPMERLPPREIEKRLRAIVLDVETRLASGEKAVSVGILSADDRDRWSENLSHLLSLSPQNHATHLAMVHSVMALSLDHTTHTISPSTSELAVDAHLHTIRSTPLNIANRFFDKSFTLIVDPSTHAGVMGEHSPCDALVPSIVTEYGVIQGVDVDAFNNDGQNNPSLFQGSKQTNGWERLDWLADTKIQKECVAAEARAIKILEDSDNSVLWFDRYGTEWMKMQAKLAPDAYIQMALQLAWYKTRGAFTATYETVLTRMFRHGRTETLRTFTKESRAWVLSMMDPRTSATDRRRALERAVQTHVRLTREAATGRGIDRHLLGLRLLLRPLNGESAALFEDELFERSSTWKLSTSGLSAGGLFKGTGFGTVYPDGYGINYLAASEIIKFGIESKHSSPLTSTALLKSAIIEALSEMQYIYISQEKINLDGLLSQL